MNAVLFIDRIEMISIVNPKWAVKITQFLENFPEFKKYRGIASMTEKAVSSNEEWMPITLFENLIYYICSSGVRYSYAVNQFKIIIKYLRCGDWNYITGNLYNFLNNNNIQPKKKSIYWNTLLWMHNNGINNNTITYEHILVMKNQISGIGDGLVAYITSQFTNSDNCLEYTDIIFCKGFEKVYGTKNKSIIKQKCQDYTNKGFGRVANSFMFQIYHYA